MGNRRYHSFFCNGDIGVYVFNKFFYVLALGVVVRGARVVHYGQFHIASKSGNVGFGYVNERAYHRYAASAHVRFGRKGGKSPFVKQREQKGFGEVVGVVSERELVAPELLHYRGKRAAAHFGAQRARVFLFAHVEYHVAYIGAFEHVGHGKGVAKLFYGRVVRTEPEVYRNGGEFELLCLEPAER